MGDVIAFPKSKARKPEAQTPDVDIPALKEAARKEAQQLIQAASSAQVPRYGKMYRAYVAEYVLAHYAVHGIEDTPATAGYDDRIAAMNREIDREAKLVRELHARGIRF